MSYDPTRKSFLGKLAGLAAAIGLAPRAVAESAWRSAAPARTGSERVPFAINPDKRAVARRADSV